jgi:PncC family amidohydrolase
MEEAIQQLFIQKGWTLGVAESCTGGAICARLVKHAGASEYFLGGIVAYSNELKEKLLGVRKGTLDLKGAVSQETAKEMALGILQMMKSDFAVAVTGVAGPSGGTERSPVGTVWIAVVRKGQEPSCFKVPGPFGNREEIIERSVTFALETLYLKAKG